MNPKVTRELIDKHFSLQWCRDNFVCPIRIDRNDEGKDKLIIAIGNKSYLVTIGSFMKKRVAKSGFECVFIEMPHNEIHDLLEDAAEIDIGHRDGPEAVGQYSSAVQYPRSINEAGDLESDKGLGPYQENITKHKSKKDFSQYHWKKLFTNLAIFLLMGLGSCSLPFVLPGKPYKWDWYYVNGMKYWAEIQASVATANHQSPDFCVKYAFIYDGGAQTVSCYVPVNTKEYIVYQCSLHVGKFKGRCYRSNYTFSSADRAEAYKRFFGTSKPFFYEVLSELAKPLLEILGMISLFLFLILLVIVLPFNLIMYIARFINSSIPKR